jgi:hypothetical protein
MLSGNGFASRLYGVKNFSEKVTMSPDGSPYADISPDR